MQSQGNANHFISIGLNFGILIASIWPTWVVLSGLERNHEGDGLRGKQVSHEDQSEQGAEVDSQRKV